MKRLYILAVLCLPFACYSQLEVSSSINMALIAQNFFADTSIHVSNIVFLGDSLSRGIFNAQNTNLGIPNGIILATGPINTTVVGPNTLGSVGTDTGPASFPSPASDHDADLDTIIWQSSPGEYSNDASVLEFDILSTTSTTIEIPYVFGSEEYPEFVGSVNDILAILITGGGYHKKNIATVPGTDIVVCVSNVNDASNAEYYIDNTGSFDIQFDGLTTPLIASATIIPYQTYHLKIAVADVSDGVWDSGVFIGTSNITTGLNTNNPTPIFTVFPNPSNGNLFLNYSYKNPATIELYDMLGKVVLNKKIQANSGTVAIPTDGMAKGIYNLKINAGNGMISVKKVIIN